MKKLPMLVIAGGIIFSAAIFAAQLGLDNDTGWGRGRIFIAGIGIALILINLVIIKYEGKIAQLLKKITTLSKKIIIFNTSGTIKFYILITTVFVISTYFWYAHPTLNTESKFDYYGRMAIAFKNKQLQLLEEPSQTLLSLSDPYNYTLRDEANLVDKFPIDISLYKGKFYFYWGPGPSILLTFFNSEQIASIKDKHIAFIFISGLFLYLLLFILKIWNQFKQTLPVWFVIIFILTLGLSAPATWMIRKSAIYESAIFGGQFFLIGGFYWIYTSLGKENISHSKLLLGSIHWAFALATRLTTWPVILFSTATTLLFILKDYRTVPIKGIISKTILLSLPLMLGVAGLGWYNWARFDSVSEFGTRYQLANVDYNKFKETFSLNYMQRNLHNYFTYPVEVQQKFPYLKPVENTLSNERMAGFIYTSPWILFVFIPLFRFLYAYSTKQDGSVFTPLEAWFFITIGASSMIMLLLILSFYFPAMRYLEDFIPLYFLITFFILAKEYNLSRGSLISQLYLLLFATLGFWSITTNSLLALPKEHIVNIIRSAKQIYNWIIFW